MARGAAFHTIVTQDINDCPVVAIGTIKHALVTILGRLVADGTLTEETPWYYLKVSDASYAFVNGVLERPETEGALTAYEFWEQNKWR